MGAPRGEVFGDGVDDLLIEVETEVVTGREVRQPLVADRYPPPVDLLDDGVDHGVGVLESRKVGAGVEPAFKPVVICASPRPWRQSEPVRTRRRPLRRRA